MVRNGALAPEDDEHAGQTPEESLEASYLSLRAKTAQDLLERVQTCSPRFFEKLVVDLLVAMGYGGSRKDAGQAMGHSGDGGVDRVLRTRAASVTNQQETGTWRAKARVCATGPDVYGASAM